MPPSRRHREGGGEKQRSRGDDTKRTANVKERVAQCELDVKATEEIILQQSQLIQQIKSENNDVRNDLKRFRAEIERLLSDEVAKIKEPVQIP